MTGMNASKMMIMATVIVLPPIFLEILLVHVSGREFSLGNICLSIFFGFLGLEWLDADRQRPTVVPAAAAQHSL
jgi:hypothetical protein